MDIADRALAMKLEYLLHHLTWLAAAATAVAQPATSAFQVADLDRTEVNSTAVGTLDGATLDGVYYFAAREPRFGFELWASDGSEEGTYLFADLCPGLCSSEPRALTVVDGRIYFWADDGVFGVEPWSTDGTRDGTRLVSDVCRGTCGSLSDRHRRFVLLDGRIFFAADDGVTGVELWSTDGSQAGATRVADLCRGACSTYPSFPFVAGSQLFFTGQSEARLDPLFVSDGTEGGTREILSGCVDCLPLADFGGRLFFRRQTPEVGREMWTSDGTAAGTELVRDLCPGDCDGLDPYARAIVWNGSVFFPGQSTAGEGAYLYRTDGTADGTELVLGGVVSPHRRVDLLRTVEDQLFFSADNGGPRRLHRTDGTVAGTVLLGPDDVYELVPAGNRVFLRAGFTDDLWVAGAADAGSQLLLTLPHVTGHLFALWQLRASGDRLFFRGYTAEAKGELWTSDGTPRGTRLVRDIYSGPRFRDVPAEITPLGDAVLFAADDDRGAAGIWRSDGSEAGTFALGSGPWDVPAFFRYGDELVYTSLSSASFADTDGLWRTDGTPGGTRRVAPHVAYAQNFVDAGDGLFFSATFEEGIELWRSDLTEEGTYQVKDIYPGTTGIFPPIGNNSSWPHDLRALDGGVLFAAETGELGEELLTSDGTAEGTAVVKDICEGACSSHPADLVRFAGSFYFAAEEPEAGRELWTSDGTAEGTALAVDLLPGAPGSAPHELVEFDGRLFFFARGADGGELLWESDGSAAGTRAVADLAVDGLPSFVTASLVAGGRLFFVAANQATGPELWASAGTPETTRMLEIRPGPRGAYPGPLAAIDGVAVFAADDGVHGREPWASEGTEVRLLADVARGGPSSSPTYFAAAGRLVFFQADDGETGRELWALERAPLTAFRLLARLRGALRGSK